MTVIKHTARGAPAPTGSFVCKQCATEKPKTEKCVGLLLCKACYNSARREKRKLRKKGKSGKRFERWEHNRKLYLNFQNPAKDVTPRGNLDDYTEDDWAAPDRISVDDLKFIL